MKNKKEDSNSISSVGYNFQIQKTNEQNISLLEGLTGVLFGYLLFVYQDMPLTEEALFLKF